jgi:hypothetical protein
MQSQAEESLKQRTRKKLIKKIPKTVPRNIETHQIQKRLTKNQIRQIQGVDIVALLLRVRVPLGGVDDAGECSDGGFHREDQQV